MNAITNLVPAAIYNVLPHIHENSDVPVKQANDLEDLRLLLVKYNMPAELGIRLIHKHFDVNEDEIMVFRDLDLPSYGKVQIMQPMNKSEATDTYPVHFLVNQDGLLQAYEYTTAKVELTAYQNFEPFVTEFINIVSARGLQAMFGLKIDLEKKDGLDKLEDQSSSSLKNTSWTEFEFPEKRSTVLLPDGMPMPEGEFEISVSTEWYSGPAKDDVTCNHSKRTCKHCTHCRQHQAHANHHATDDIELHEGDHLDLYFGGYKLESSDPFHGVVSQLVQVW